MSYQSREHHDIANDYFLIEKAIEYIDANSLVQPTLKDISDQVGLSEHHFQKLFSRWAGISPKRFLQYITKEHIKKILHEASIEEAAFSAGLSTKSRLYDLMVSCEALSPGEYKSLGKGLTITYGFHPTPFGLCLIAVTPRGICKLSFLDPSKKEKLKEELFNEWHQASIVESQVDTANYIEQIFMLSENKKPLHLVLKGTNFQLKVWEALLHVPLGKLSTYHQIATNIDNPKGVRAVGSAIGKNPIAFLIPCHRVIRKTGEINQYRWGSQRKQAIIGWEQAQKK